MPIHNHSFNKHIHTFIKVFINTHINIYSYNNPFTHYIHTVIVDVHIHAFILAISNGPGFGSNRTEPLSHGLKVYKFPKN